MSDKQEGTGAPPHRNPDGDDDVDTLHPANVLRRSSSPTPTFHDPCVHGLSSCWKTSQQANTQPAPSDFAIAPAQHNAPEKAALEDKSVVQGRLRELEKAHSTFKHGDGGHAHGPAAGQRGYNKTAVSANNKMMDSRHRHGDAVGKTHRGMDDGSRANAN